MKRQKNINKIVNIIGLFLYDIYGLMMILVGAGTYNLYINDTENLLQNVNTVDTSIIANLRYECGFVFLTAIIVLLIILSSVILTISYIRKNRDTYLIGIVLSVISVFFLIVAYIGNLELISIIPYVLVIILIIVGFILDKPIKKKQAK